MVSISDCTAPFAVQFVTNAIAADTTGAQTQRGVCLEYKQVTCWVNHKKVTFICHLPDLIIQLKCWSTDTNIFIQWFLILCLPSLNEMLFDEVIKLIFF